MNHPAQDLPVIQIVAHNYATGSDNRIHSDDVAAQYGFAGGLVPGIGLYAYLTRPIVAVFGRAWLERGSMSAKFLKPVYDGETVSVRAGTTNDEPGTISLTLVNSAGTLCAIGQANLSHTQPAPDPADYPGQKLPMKRLPPAITSLPVGLSLGSRAVQFNPAEMAQGFVSDMRDPLPLYRGADAACHPALLPTEANHILMDNVALGPWIHTASEVQHYVSPQPGEWLSLRGSIAESYVRRGHEFVVLDLAMFGANEHPVARIRHTAIVHLHAPE